MKRKYKFDFMKKMGLVVAKDNWAMMYGFNHGFMTWAPDWLKKGICGAWNHVACSIRGHDDIGVSMYKAHVAPGKPKCCYCSATLKIDGRYVTPEEIAAHNEICYANFDKEFAESSDVPEKEPLP